MTQNTTYKDKIEQSDKNALKGIFWDLNFSPTKLTRMKSRENEASSDRVKPRSEILRGRTRDMGSRPYGEDQTQGYTRAHGLGRELGSTADAQLKKETVKAQKLWERALNTRAGEYRVWGQVKSDKSAESQPSTKAPGSEPALAYSDQSSEIPYYATTKERKTAL